MQRRCAILYSLLAAASHGASTLCQAEAQGQGQGQAAASGAARLAPFDIVSGDLPPFSVQDHATAPGALVELAQLLAARLRQVQLVRFYPWARAIATAQSQHRVAVLPLTRTPERENQFTWLVKLYAQRFVAIRHQGPAPDTLEQLRGLKIVVLRGSPTHMHLMRHDFKPELVQIEAKNEKMFKALDAGLVDVIYGSEQINLEVIKNTGRKTTDYKFGAMIDQGEIWLAGGNGFTAADVTAFGAAMESLKQDGSYARILQKYALK